MPTRIARLHELRAILVAYLEAKTREQDWHGVSDAANDLRELEAELKGITMPAKRMPTANPSGMGPGMSPQQLRGLAAGRGSQVALPKPRQSRGGVTAKMPRAKKGGKGLPLT